MKLYAIYEELSAITVVDLEYEVHLYLSKDLFERVLMGYDLYGDLMHSKLCK